MIQQQGWFSTYDLCILETEQKTKHYSINVSCDRNLKAFFHISNRQTVEWNLNQWNQTLKYSIPPTHLKRMAPIENSEGHGYMADHRPGPAASIKLNLKTNRLGRPYRAVADHNHRPDIHKLQTDLKAWNIWNICKTRPSKFCESQIFRLWSYLKNIHPFKNITLKKYSSLKTSRPWKIFAP